MPKHLNASLDMSVDVVRYNGGVIRKAGLRAVLSNGAITLDRASALFPGGSDVSMFGFLETIDGAPHFEGEVAAASDNLRAVLDWLSIDTSGVSKDHLRGFSYASKVKATPQDIEVTDINIRLDASTMTGALALALRERPGIGLRLEIDRLNLDSYRDQSGAGNSLLKPNSAKSNSAQPNPVTTTATSGKAATVSKGVPVLNAFDANFDFQVDRLTLQGATFRKLKTVGLLVGGDLTLRRFSVVDAMGVAATVSGDLKGLDDTPSYALNYDVTGKDP
ncbi:MAG: hypothetical protein JKY20_04580, partial [Alphaproteobacteria bacterium]|nr:hypothetical protein [Alphaproteobacteria bacterium]